MFLGLLRSYLEGESNRKKSIMRLLGCAGSTAAAMMSSSKEYTSARLPIQWAYRLCHAMGEPLDALLGRDMRTMQEAIAGWANTPPGGAAIHAATTLGVAISCRALVGYNYSGTIAVDHELGEVTRLTVTLNSQFDCEGQRKSHYIVIGVTPAPGGGRQTVMRCMSAHGHDVRDVLSLAVIERMLTELYKYDRKNQTTDRRRTA